VKKLKKV